MSGPGAECQERHKDLLAILSKADVAWQSLEAKLNDLEDGVFEDKFELFVECYGIEKADVGNWVPGGFRSTARANVHRLILEPLKNKMIEKVNYEPPKKEEPEEEEDKQNLLQALFAHSDQVLSKVTEAAAEDHKLDKKIKKTEKEEKSKGIMGLGMQDSKKVAALKRQRPEIWEKAKAALDDFTATIKRLGAFVEAEMTDDAMNFMLSQAPAVICRSLSDWFFDKYSAEMTQLQKWWDTTSNSLRANQELWDGLQNKEGLFIRRIEKGLEEIRIRHHRYGSYANFGNNEVKYVKGLAAPERDSQGKFWSKQLDEALLLVAKVLAEIRERLKQIRDSAMWRLIEAARILKGTMNEQAPEVSVWDKVSAEDGALNVFQDLESCAEYPDSDDFEDMILGTMRRVDRLIGISTEVQDFFGKDSIEPREGVVLCMEASCRSLANMHEELLGVLDDPCKETARDWLMLWGQWDGASLGEDLEETFRSMPLKKDSELNGRALAQRTKHLTWLRGLQCLMQGTQSLRSNVVATLHADVSGAPRPEKGSSGVSKASAVLEDGEVLLNPRPLEDMELVELQSEPPSPRDAASAQASDMTLLSHREFTGGSANRAKSSPGEAPQTSQTETPSSAPPNKWSDGRGGPPPVPPLQLGSAVGTPPADLNASLGSTGGLPPSGLPPSGHATPQRKSSRKNSTPKRSDSFGNSTPKRTDSFNFEGRGSPPADFFPSRPDSAQSNSRPPSAKFVDGQFVPLRPNSASKRLPPLHAPPVVR
eukprot:gnl/MRDRNA2_/MRDRNA2_28124_c0_seq2.p1 gnl/MRDRNA2_/MRDRNA2_28124_c0~~gnl/MRDRNA2_/MRDRNA2_28124_c0_seq2.p1  ORF type:complete len:764 (+),score=179.78 gnl/MRDRNA2_/MRDRNA2_28124_c0_seq2:124-2415(+)